MGIKLEYRFRGADKVGAAAAEDDADFLSSCFVDSGEISRLRDCNDPACIVLGRSGSGKTALLLRLGANSERAISLNPHDLALSYLANSDILRFVESLGVKIDILFRLLWRHALIVEILKVHFKIHDKSQKNNFLAWFNRDKAREDRHKRARSYLDTWGDSFWERTEVRVRELISNIEEQIRGSLGVSFGMLDFEAEGQHQVSEQVKAEVRHRARDVINSVQLRELTSILELLDDILEDRQKPYYVVIDQLDEDWVEDSIRLRLIRSLIEACRDFRRVSNAKVVVALRSDLIDRVYRKTRDEGFQEEKIESLYLRIGWTVDDIESLLDRRVGHLIRKRYEPRAEIRIADLLPKTLKVGRHRGDRESGLIYLLRRTMMRPRDAIAFLNTIISFSDGRADFSGQILKQAEGEYSRNRLKALQDEWFSLYPNLIRFTQWLAQGSSSVIVGDLEEQTLAFVTEVRDEEDLADDELHRALRIYFNNQDLLGFARSVLSVFYRVGLVGLKISSIEAPHWSPLGTKAISLSEIDLETKVLIHPCFWRVLGCKDGHSGFKPC